MNRNRMKFGCVLGAAALTLSLVACGPAAPSSQPEPPSSSQNGSDIQETQLTPIQQLEGEFEAVPQQYTPEQAAADNLLVVAQGKVQPSWELLDSFLQDVQEGQKSVFKMVQYTAEGDPILTGVAFNGEEFEGLTDSTRDTFAGEGSDGLTEFYYTYLKTFESEGKRYVYLLDDDTITLEQLQEGALKSDAGERVDAMLLFYAEQ